MFYHVFRVCSFYLVFLKNSQSALCRIKIMKVNDSETCDKLEMNSVSRDGFLELIP